MKLSGRNPSFVRVGYKLSSGEGKLIGKDFCKIFDIWQPVALLLRQPIYIELLRYVGM